MKIILNHKIAAAAILVTALALLFGGVWAGKALAQDQPEVNPQSIENPEMLAQTEFLCTIDNVTVYTDRIHVRCTNPPLPGVFYFASSNDSATIRHSNQFLLMLNTAAALNKQIAVRFETAITANPSGCNTNDCRKLIGLSLKP